MRNKTQERIEELARERGAVSIDLALVEDGIEIGKKMMAEMIATYNAPSPGGNAHTGSAHAGPTTSVAPAREAPEDGGSSYLNEVRSH
jgi:hypothetical protein